MASLRDVTVRGTPARRRVIGSAVIAAAAEAAVNVPIGDWHDRLPVVVTTAGVAIAVIAGAVGGWIPAAVAVAIGWTLNFFFVADDRLDAALALPVWIAAAGAAAWLATRVRDHRLAKRRLAAIGDAAADAIVRIDGAGAITAWSPSAERLYGYTSGEVLGRPLADLFADPGPAERLVATTNRGERFWAAAVDQRKQDGTGFSASISAVPVALEEAVVLARDVGEVRRVTDRLHDVETRYRSLTEHLPLVTYVRSVDDDRRTTFVSPQLQQLLGYTPDEWLADETLARRLVHPEDRDRVAADRAAAEPARTVRSNYRMIARDGRVVHVRDEGIVVLDERGRPLFVQGYLLDVSERKRAEDERNELRAAVTATNADVADRQRKLELVAASASVLASSFDLVPAVAQVAALATRQLAEWCVVDVLEEDGTLNRVAAEHRAPRSSLPEPDAHPDADVLAVVHERRTERTESRMRIPMMSRGGRAAGVISFMTLAHERRYAADDLPWARAIAAMVALAIDNSRLLREVEARSDANKVLTHVGDGVLLVDRGGLIRLWNPAAAAITGVLAESAVGKSATEAIPGWHEIAERIPVGATHELVASETLPLDTETGERWITISGVEFFAGTVYAFRDSTEAHRLDELKAEFIAVASHELRTPLAAVYGAAQTLRRHDFALDEAGRERFISLIVDESERLARIINQILLANQLEVGRVDLATEPFDPAELLERVVEAARTYAPAHVTFDVVAADDVPPVAADKDRVRQIVVNLLDNAIKYSPGGGRIELGVESSDGAAVFRVVDEGVGIAPDEQRRIFEKFYRLDPDMTRGIGGTGLGLYICSELVERMGGRIWVESQESEGSAFFVELPTVGSLRGAPKSAQLDART